VNPRLRVAKIPNRPVILYDGDCRFCTLWIRRWRQITGDGVDYIPFQDDQVAQLYPEVPRQGLEAAVHFLDIDGVVYSGAEAVFRSLATNPAWGWPLRLYREWPWFAHATERNYAFIARRRLAFSRLTRLMWGQHVERLDYYLVRRLFLVSLGLIYLIAFVSLGVQVQGLIGKDGILPVADLMSRAHQAVTAEGIGISRFHLLPTLCWFDASDGFPKLQCAAGAGLALLLIVGVAPPLCLALLWVLYLSLTTVGGDFLAFQWDNLLLEVGFLAIFLGPFQLLPRRARERPTSRTALWLLRLLLFKLMFLSGVVKLASGDPAWRSLSALTYHYETQPLPNWVAWYVHQLPFWFQKTSCVAMFLVELVIPFLIFMPRRIRMVGGLLLTLLQILILVTGNYTFFNWLTLTLCILLVDDFALRRLLPQKISTLYLQHTGSPSARAFVRALRIAPIVIIFVSISMIQLLAPLRLVPSWTSPVVDAYRWLSPFRTVNSYGLFAVMTTERPEIIVEGSEDGRDWKEYGFPYKPGDLNRRPRFVAPYQPRVDWQMWFAALGNARQNPWFINFCIRVLQGSPNVLALLQKNPFPEKPPKYIRARLYDYRFTTFAERGRTGAWWKRTLKGEYLPPISLEMLHKHSEPAAPAE
jgi:predicted DCC family thiol-disulfide oxidoreductase YuxK